MDASTPTKKILSFSCPAVRHLAWLCMAPQLISSSSLFEPGRYLPPDYLDTLQAWDRNPESAPRLLREPPQRRLGFYFERLYEVLLSDLLGWDILLKNAQIQSNGRTLGELDFIVQNPIDDRIEHHEIAIKYYLGVPRGSHEALWYGPNARDRLDLKSDRLINHQSRRTHQPETLQLLKRHGITGPITARVFMPGYLFYPLNEPISAPGSAPSNHLYGWWAYASEVTKADTANWVLLQKPHWVGPWHQSEAPQPQESTQALTMIDHDQIPRLFAELAYDRASDTWCEQRRLFIVPGSWPAGAK